MSDSARKDLHALVDALPPGEEQAARRYLEYLRDACDPFAPLDRTDPFAGMAAEERAKLHAALARAEAEISAGLHVEPEELLRELKSSR